MLKQKRSSSLLWLQIILVILAFTKSFGAGVLTLAVLWLLSHELSQFEETVRLLMQDEKEEARAEKETPIATVKGMCTNFTDYQGFTIENFNNKLYRVTCPNGNVLDTLYPSEQAARQIVDELAPTAERPEHEHRKVHNIRFVR